MHKYVKKGNWLRPSIEFEFIPPREAAVFEFKVSRSNEWPIFCMRRAPTCRGAGVVKMCVYGPVMSNEATQH